MKLQKGMLSKLVLVAIALVVSYVALLRFRFVFIFGSLLFLAAVSRTYNHVFWLPQLGFELYSASTILTGLLLGPWPGFFQGILSNFFAYFFSGKIKFYAYISMAAWALIGFVCGLIAPLNINITLLGMFFIIAYDLLTTPIFVASGARITSAAFHLFTHILISMFLFSTFVPLIYRVLR